MSKVQLRILLAGESWMTHGIHIKGFASYTTGSYEVGVQPLRDALISMGHEFVYIPNHEATDMFPKTLEELNNYDVIIFSDLPADTLLLHNDTFILGKITQNRLKLVVEFIRAGGGFLMIGGYMSFSGYQAKAGYHFSPLTQVLPIGLYGIDDRIEAPEGVVPEVTMPEHPILNGIPQSWPFFLGYNKLKPGDGNILMTCQEDPFLSVRQVGKGRVAAFASDCSPHWAPTNFTNWEYYPRFWDQLVIWLASRK